MKKEFYSFLLLSCLVAGTTCSDHIIITRAAQDGTKHVTQLASQSPSILCGLGMVAFGGLGWYLQQNYVTPAFTTIRQGLWGESVADNTLPKEKINIQEVLNAITEKTLEALKDEDAREEVLAAQGHCNCPRQDAQRIFIAGKLNHLYEWSRENQKRIKEEQDSLWISPQTKNIIANSFGAAAGISAFLWLRNHPF